MQYYYNQKVRFLLVNQPVGKEEMRYAQNANKWKVPQIGPRPPFYFNPRYEKYYPVI